VFSQKKSPRTSALLVLSILIVKLRKYLNTTLEKVKPNEHNLSYFMKKRRLLPAFYKTKFKILTYLTLKN